MTRYIDADAVEKVLTELYIKRPLDSDRWVIADIKKGIMDLPTIDAEPVRHGKWIGYAGTIGNECSVCGKWIDVLQGTAEMNYCPNCGADMRGEE